MIWKRKKEEVAKGAGIDGFCFNKINNISSMPYSSCKLGFHEYECSTPLTKKKNNISSTTCEGNNLQTNLTRNQSNL